jgi:UDP-N-acetylglucosamine 1-carboxyvinyltransferase
MDSFKITGGQVLKGTIEAGGSKNCALPVLFSTLLSSGKHKISRVPKLRDMDSTLAMLVHLGAEIDQHHTSNFGSDWIVNCANQKDIEAPYDLVRKMRASVLVLGPLLARYGHARVSLPGGCAIGARPIDLHIRAFEKMGAIVKLDSGYVEATLPMGQKKLRGDRIIFPTVSVGATENAMMAATLADGTTIIENASREPEVRDLAKALISMGAKITGVGTSTLQIEGQKELGSMNFEIPRDRIESATYLIGAALTQGDVEVLGADPVDLDLLLEKLTKAGATVEVKPKSIRVKGGGRLLPVDISTAPFPGFATDMQAQWMVLMTQAQGVSLITETIFENRFMHVPELNRMGAKLKIAGNVVKVEGTPGQLQGAPVMATDLRASASLVLAGLAAKGQTTVKRIYHLDRGYESMEVKLRSLGAQVERETAG